MADQLDAQFGRRSPFHDRGAGTQAPLKSASKTSDQETENQAGATVTAAWWAAPRNRSPDAWRVKNDRPLATLCEVLGGRPKVSSGARGAVPADKAECRLWVQKGDDRRNAPQRARCAECSHSTRRRSTGRTFNTGTVGALIGNEYPTPRRRANSGRPPARSAVGEAQDSGSAVQEV